MIKLTMQVMKMFNLKDGHLTVFEDEEYLYWSDTFCLCRFPKKDYPNLSLLGEKKTMTVDEMNKIRGFFGVDRDKYVRAFSTKNQLARLRKIGEVFNSVDMVHLKFKENQMYGDIEGEYIKGKCTNFEQSFSAADLPYDEVKTNILKLYRILSVFPDKVAKIYMPSTATRPFIIEEEKLSFLVMSVS